VGGSAGAGDRPPIELNRLAAGAVPAADLVAQLLAPDGSPTPLLVGLGVPDAEEAQITNLREHVRRSSGAAVVLHAADRRLAASAPPGAGLTST
jgi:hypothetical protein